jgi:hypothetical protein
MMRGYKAACVYADIAFDGIMGIGWADYGVFGYTFC